MCYGSQSGRELSSFWAYKGLKREHTNTYMGIDIVQTIFVL